MSDCKCRYIRYLNGSVARAIDPNCTVHGEPTNNWEYIKAWAAIIAVFGVAILLFWGFAKTCGGGKVDSKECEELIHNAMMSGGGE